MVHTVGSLPHAGSGFVVSARFARARPRRPLNAPCVATLVAGTPGARPSARSIARDHDAATPPPRPLNKVIKSAAMTKTVLRVDMACEGCANAVRRVLGKLEGVQSVDIDLPQQKVTVESTSDPEVVKAQVAKSGKKTELWA